MSEIIDRVMDALDAAFSHDDLSRERWARAVIAALREPTHPQVRAMAESRAKDDEGEFEPLMDLVGFSGENKTHTVLRAAYTAAMDEALK